MGEAYHSSMNNGQVADIRQTQEAQLARMRRLEHDKLSATPSEQTDIDSQIEIVAEEIRRLDVLLRGLIEPAT